MEGIVMIIVNRAKELLSSGSKAKRMAGEVYMNPILSGPVFTTSNGKEIQSGCGMTAGDGEKITSCTLLRDVNRGG